jgi:hypothetical protein
MATQCVWKTPPSTEPIEIPKRNGMLISLSGVLGRAAETCKRSRDNKHLAYSLAELQKHIEELREYPTPETLGEFLSLWTWEN